MGFSTSLHNLFVKEIEVEEVEIRLRDINVFRGTLRRDQEKHRYRRSNSHVTSVILSSTSNGLH